MAIASSSGGNAHTTSTSFWIRKSIGAGEVAGDGAQNDADDAGDDHDQDRDHQRNPGAIEQTREDVAADRIGAEHVRSRQPVGRAQRVREVLGIGIVRRDPGAPQSDDDQDQHDSAAGDELRRQPGTDGAAQPPAAAGARPP